MVWYLPNSLTAKLRPTSHSGTMNVIVPKNNCAKDHAILAQVKGEKYKILKMMGTKLEFLLHHSNNSKNKGTKFILSYMTMQRFN